MPVILPLISATPSTSLSTLVSILRRDTFTSDMSSSKCSTRRSKEPHLSLSAGSSISSSSYNTSTTRASTDCHIQASLPIATAVSTMRLEKPHSLSYHDITRTSVPSSTLVWSMWKTDECGAWLKSLEPLGASV